MSRASGWLLLLGTAACSSAAVAQASPADAQAIAQALQDAASTTRPATCTSKDPKAVIVCGRSGERYRIDPVVLETAREAEAVPPKPPLGDGASDSDCVGPQHCGGGTIPLVGMALAGIKAAVLAAQGDDWRDAFRTHPDQYQLYEVARAKEAKKPRIRLGVTASDK
jgi:hypothetical protein